MIYLFDKEMKLNKSLPLNHFESAHQVKIVNGSYTLDLVTPLKFTKRGTVYNHKKAFDKAVFAGHFDENDKFQLYKLRTIAVDNNNLNIIGIHKFFDEAEAKAIIHDRRWRDSELRPIAEFALGEIGWNLIECDVTDRYNFNLFRASILDFRKDAVETYKVEMDFEIGFDGQKITSKGVRIKNRMGEETGARHAYGSNVLKIAAEEERSEVFSAVIGRGRGEESGDGFGQRIEFDNVVWSTANGDPVNKPAGQNYVELESATEKYGYYDSDGTVRPRIAVIEFDDIEDPNTLIKDSWDWLLQNSVPKAVFESKVFSLGKYNLGDSIGIIYKDAGIVKKARIHKIDRNLKDDRLTQYELGDYKHFKPETIGDVRGELKKQKRATSEWITRLKRMFDEDFDRVVGEVNDGYLNAVAEAEAKVEASEAKMNQIISGQRQEMTQKIQTAEENAIQQATQNAEKKKQEVMGSLNDFKGVHQQLYDDVTTDIIDINTFLGEKDFSLDWHLNSLREEMQDQINAVNTANPNLIVGTSLEEVELIPWNDSIVTIKRDESINYVRVNPNGDRTTLGYRFPEYVYLEQGKTYTLAIDFRSDVVNDLDYIYMMGQYNNVALTPWADKRGLTADGTWYRYYFTFDWIDTSRDARVLIGTSFNSGDTNRGYFDTRRAMLYEGSLKVPWMPSPSDNRQVITQLSREINELEDGLKSRATKTEFDLLSQDYTQFTNEFTTTAERWESELQEHDNWLNSNGSNLLQMADRVQSKVWLNDFSKVNPNLIPFANVSDEVSADMWEPWGASNINIIHVDSFGEMTMRSSSGGGATIAIKSPIFDFEAGENYVLSAIVRTSTGWNTASNMRYTYLINESGEPNEYLTADRFEYIDATRDRVTWKFQPTFTGKGRVMIGTYRLNADQDARFSFREPKVEKGTERTPFMNAFSNVEQLANKINMEVQELDGEVVKQSGIYVGASGIQIGSTYVGDEEFASIFNVSPRTIDVITGKMRITGDLAVAGDIESISMNAVNANIAELRTNILTSNVITSDMIGSNVIRAEHIFVQNAMIETIVNTNLFTDTVNTMSINAVYADLRSVNSEIMRSNIIKSEWLDVDTALFNRFTASSAFISSLTSKEVFARDINAIEVRANSQILQTMMNRFGEVKGGQKILGYDGRVVIDNGILQNTFDINFIQPGFMGVGVDTSANYYRTKNTSYSNGTAFSYKQAGRYLVVEGYCEIRSNTAGASRDTVGAIRLMEYSGGTRSSFVYIGSRNDNNDDNQYFKIELDLGVPKYNQRNFYVQFYVANAESDALFRINQAYQYH